MPKIINTGAEDYSGHRDPSDPGAGLISIPAGAEAEVSDEKAEQLLRDFPGEFTAAAAAQTERPRRRREPKEPT